MRIVMTALRLASALCVLTLGAIAVPATPAAVQNPAAVPTGTLAIAGDVSKPLTLTPADLRALPRTTVKVTDEDGRTLTYEGVLVEQLLTRAGAPIGKALRGTALATYVIASAKDGYQVVFSLGELDPAMTASEIMVADEHYAAGGRTIADGPYRGIGRDNPNKSVTIRGFTLTPDHKADLVAFLQSLTDPEVLRDPRFADPWPGRLNEATPP
jgi:hypothetical protein